MGIFDFFKKRSHTLKPEQLKELLTILEKGKSYGYDFNELCDKIRKVVSDNGNTIKVVLLGSFSDGKTSVVAGLLGQILSNMKIDQDESSDDLEFYKPISTNGTSYEFVDTPGLFGTKEKEIDGCNTRFSDITTKYISEAHIIMYVCNAIVPLIDSHKEIIRKVLRDYGKLNNTIFIINRLDETGCEMSDEEEYKRISEIKKATLIKRLKDTISLTSEEEKSLKIACIAANPNGKGMDYWLNNGNYDSFSHISQVKNMVKSVTQNADKEQLLAETNYAVMKDVTTQIQAALDSAIIPLNNAVEKHENLFKSCDAELKSLKRDLITNRGTLRTRLKTLKETTLSSINAASVETIGNVMNSLGVENDQVTLYSLVGEIDQIIKECVEQNGAKIDSKLEAFDLNFARQDEVTRGVVNAGIKMLQGVKISGPQVLAIRDLFFQSVKFKPYGAIKLGTNISKGLGLAGLGIQIATTIYDIWKRHKLQEELAKVKNELTIEINRIFAELEKSFSDDDIFYKNYAPQYFEIAQQVEIRKHNLDDCINVLKRNQDYSSNLKKWMKSVDIEDVEFKVIEN